MRLREAIAAADLLVVPGVTANAGARLNNAQIDFVRRLHHEVGFPLHVTSGERDALEQAQAMLTKLREGGADELHRTYADDQAVDELLSLPQAVETWAARLEDLADKGRMMSRHMRGAAVDLRSRDLTPDQVATLEAAVRRLHGRPLYEGTPPHLHVDLPPSLVVVPGGELAPPAAPAWVAGWTWTELLVAGAVVGGALWIGGPVLWPLAGRVSAAGIAAARRLL